MPDNAFLWQEFHSSVIKEELTTPTTDKKSEAMPKKGSAETDERFLAVLHHLVTFWEGMSQKIINHTSSSFSPPKVPRAPQTLQREEERNGETEKGEREEVVIYLFSPDRSPWQPAVPTKDETHSVTVEKMPRPLISTN